MDGFSKPVSQAGSENVGIFKNQRGRPRNGQILRYETLEESRTRAIFQKKVKEILKLYDEYKSLGYRDTGAFKENQCITKIFPEYDYDWLEKSCDFVQRIPEYLKDIEEMKYLEKLQSLLLFWINVRTVMRYLSTLSQTTYISDAERNHAINNGGFLNIEEFRKQLTGGSKMPYDPVYSAWYSKGNPYD